jgi:hypothetical protein
MIQRIQTLFLFLVTLVSGALFLVPFVQYEYSSAPLSVTLYPGNSSGQLTGLYYLPLTLNIINMVFSVFIIMQYKKRILQMKLSSILMALSCILLGVMLLFDFVKPELAGNVPVKKYLFGAYLPIISVIACFLATRAIKKDEELVRSADRIR